MISLNYDPFASTFSDSRKDLKWAEIEYFFSKYLEEVPQPRIILDIWCWNWRLITLLEENKVDYLKYLWIDSSWALLDEAKKLHPNKEFVLMEMKDINSITDKFNEIYFIASFHHLQTIEERLDVLKKAYDLLEKWWYVFMTNWALESSINYMKYMNSQIPWTENEYGSKDFQIKIWEYERFYHSFALSELEYLFEKAWFAIVENREFENKKNIISVLKKV